MVIMKNTKIFIQHKNRSLLKLSGGDVETFLQGLVTNDANQLTTQAVIFSCFLTGNGRFLYDFFLFKIGDDIIIDIISEDLAALRSRFNMYKLRSDVQLVEITGYEVYQILNHDELVLESDDIFTIFQDPRNSALGYRAYSKDKDALIKEGFYEENRDYYQYLRIKNKIVEGEDLIKEKSIILEYGYKQQSAISFDKGCYLGQELITRTERLGEIRKKLIYLNFTNKLSENQIEILHQVKAKIIVSVAYSNKYHYLIIAKHTESEIISLLA